MPQDIPMYYAFLSDSIEQMETALRMREYQKGTDLPITVGILVADYRRSFCQENIIDQLDRLNKKSGALIDFYIPGYKKTPYSQIADLLHITYKGEKYRFSKETFNAFLDALEQRNIKLTGRTQLLLVPFENGRLLLKDALGFDLEKGEDVERVGSVKLFFDYLIEISKKTTDFEEYRKTIQQDRIKSAFLDFLKEKAKDYFWSILIPS